MASRVVKLWTDGSCAVKTKLGGFGIYYRFYEDGKLIYDDIFNQGWSNTKTGRCELRGLIQCLRLVKDKDCDVFIYCDSQYVIKGASVWLEGWIRRRFEGVKNEDLWREFVEEYSKFKVGKVRFNWVKGHNGDECNEIADGLASYRNFKNNERIIDNCTHD